MAVTAKHTANRISPPDAKRQTRAFECDNREAAEIYLAEPDKYAGIMAQWARLYLRRIGVLPLEVEMEEQDELDR